MAHTEQREHAIPVRIGAKSLKPSTVQVLRHLDACAAHRHFVALLTEYGMRAKVARAWGVRPAVVDKVREGRAPLTETRIAKLPPSVFAALAANDVLPPDAA